MIKIEQSFILPPNFGLMFEESEHSYGSHSVSWCNPRLVMSKIRVGTDFDLQRYSQEAVEARVQCFRGVESFLPGNI